MFFGSKVDEGSKISLMRSIRYCLIWGVSTTEKAEFAAYQLKDVAQTWYNQWKDSSALGGGLVTWEIFRKTFLDIFLPREKREDKVEEFINLRQGGMSAKEYSLKFIKLSKYASLWFPMLGMK